MMVVLRSIGRIPRGAPTHTLVGLPVCQRLDAATSRSRNTPNKGCLLVFLVHGLHCYTALHQVTALIIIEGFIFICGSSPPLQSVRLILVLYLVSVQAIKGVIDVLFLDLLFISWDALTGV
jgi:hypothetical protein